MSRTGERFIQVQNGEACPRCYRIYPVPATIVVSVTCVVCGFVNRRATEQETRDDVNHTVDTTGGRYK